MKPFKTLDEQIEILKKRNLNFQDEEKAKKYLLNNNYYNIINHYSKFFMDTKTNNYYDNIYFENILDLHHFDKEVKQTIFKFIMEVERHFKSILAYNYTKFFNKNLYSYLDINTYEPKYILEGANTIASFSKKITTKKKTRENNSIKHYINNHNSVPFWVLVNYLTFGEVLKFYEINKGKITNSVVKDLLYFLEENTSEPVKKEIPAKNIILILENIQELRNIVAHNNILLNLNLRNDLPYLDIIHDKLGIKKEDNRQSLYHTILFFQFFLTKNQYEELINTLKKRIKKLRKKIDEIYFKKVISVLGFPFTEFWIGKE